jgi:hypothetical protein
MPPNKKISNKSPSSGDISFVAEGSSKQTLPFSSARKVSTLLVSMRRPGASCSSLGSSSVDETDDKQNPDPAAFDSSAMERYSSFDQGPNSGSRCSTTYSFSVDTILSARSLEWTEELVRADARK